MTGAASRAGTGDGEALLTSLYRLLNTSKLYGEGNPQLRKCVSDFTESLLRIWAVRDAAELRIYRGRFYAGNERIVYSQSVWPTAAKLAELFAAMGVEGLSWRRRDELPAGDVVEFARLVAEAQRRSPAGPWLDERFAEAPEPWISLLADNVDRGTGDAADASAAAGRPVAVPGRTDELPLTLLARKTYSRTLTILMTMTGRIASNKRVGVQKAKRAVQDLQDVLAADENLFLALSTIRDSRDCIYVHSLNVCILCLAVGRRLGLGRTALERLALSALLHDMGKADVPEGRLYGPEVPDGPGLEELRGHVVHSISRILMLNVTHQLKAKFMVPVFGHHRGVDDSGYPASPGGEPPGLFGRIMAASDHYDAMTSVRPHRPVPLSFDKALNVMVGLAGTKLDPIVVRALINTVGLWPLGSVVILNSGETAMVAGTPAGSDPDRPLLASLVRKEGGFSRGAAIDLRKRPDLSISACLNPLVFSIQAMDILAPEA